VLLNRAVSPQLAAGVAALGLVILVLFQAALAAGAPWGRASWGGRYERLPANLRISSAVAVVVWLGAALIVLDRGGLPLLDVPDVVSYWGTWALVPLLIIGALVNFASSSPYERFGWGPFALVVAVLVFFVAVG
jgi:hypothetical protein